MSNETNINLEANERLIPMGFKQQGNHFFLVKEPNIIVLLKSRFQSVDRGYFLAFIHTFFSNLEKPNSKIKIPLYLENYPISISTAEIQEEFYRYNLIHQFDHKMNFGIREVLTSRNIPSGPSFLTKIKLKLKQKYQINDYKLNPIDVTLQEGLKFF